MGTINVNSLKPGMVLADDVRDRNGRMLLTTGTTLQDQQLRVLKIWGVTEAEVEGVEQENVEEETMAHLNPEFLAAAASYADDRFRHNDQDHEVVAELRRVCVLRKAQEAQRQGLTPEDFRAALEKQMAVKSRGDSVPTRKKHERGTPQADGEKTSAAPVAPPAPPAPPAPVDAEELITDDLSLGSLPVVFHRLVEVVNDPRSSAQDVAEIVGNDPDLSVRLLKIVNSAFYGLRAEVDTISRAVAILGSNQLVSLAMGISVVTSFKGIPEDLLSMRSFWKHSVSVGIGARILASHHKTPNTERFFVAGLLHDIGRLIVYKALPAHAHLLLGKARQEEMLLVDLEPLILGFTHHQLGGMLLKKWKLPVSLEQNVGYHHETAKAPNRLEAAIIQMADMLSHALEMGTSGEYYVPRLSTAVWDGLELPVSVITQTAVQLDYQVDEVLQFLTTDG